MFRSRKSEQQMPPTIPTWGYHGLSFWLPSLSYFAGPAASPKFSLFYIFLHEIILPNQINVPQHKHIFSPLWRPVVHSFILFIFIYLSIYLLLNISFMYLVWLLWYIFFLSISTHTIKDISKGWSVRVTSLDLSLNF